MSKQISGRVGEVVWFGLGARNWLLAQMEGSDTAFSWTPPKAGRSAEEIVNHITWVITAVCQQIASDIGVDLAIPEPKEVEGVVPQLVEDVKSAYLVFKKFCESVDDEKLDHVATLPPPARLREGSIETILRIMTGYHVVHHAGQIASLLKRAN